MNESRYKPVRACNCTSATPKNIRAKRYNCPVHLHLRYGESLYKVAGQPIKFVRRMYV